jgi:hypothetical protein
VNSKNFNLYCPPFAAIRGKRQEEIHSQEHAPHRAQPDGWTPPSKSRRLTRKGDTAIGKEFNTPWD